MLVGYTYGGALAGSVAALETYDLIAVSPVDLSSPVTISILDGGFLDLWDELAGRAAAIFASPFGNQIVAGARDDLLVGSSGFDFLDGREGDDVLLGGDGSDSLRGGPGNDHLDGGADGPWGDVALYDDSPAAVHVDLRLGFAFDGWGGRDTLVGVEQVVGSRFGDVLIGDDRRNLFTPGDGDDVVDGGGGSDSVFYFSSAPVIVDLREGWAMGADIGRDRLISIENVHGSRFGDIIQLGDAHGYVFGRAGGDLLKAGAGGSRLIGGSGADMLFGGAGRDEAYFADEGFDEAGPISRGVDVDLASGVAIDGWGDRDLLVGIEDVVGTHLADAIRGDAGSNVLHGGAGDDVLEGRGGDDRLFGGDGDDRLFGGDGFDRLQGGRGNDLLDGGGGRANAVTYRNEGGPSGVLVDFSRGFAIDSFGDRDTLVDVNEAEGTRFADAFVGATTLARFRDEFWIGHAGADSFTGGVGFSTIAYDQEDGPRGIVFDWAAGTAIDSFGDLDVHTGIEFVRGTRFADVFIGDAGENHARGGAGDDRFDLGGGFDEVRYDRDPAGVTVDLAAGFAIDGWGGRDTLVGVERARGSAFADVLLGDDGDNRFWGFAGADLIDGRGGEDELIYDEEPGPIYADLAAGYVIDGYGDRDVVLSIEKLHGGAWSDVLLGSEAGERIWGRGGDDVIEGGGGDDILMGEDGDDRLYGGDGFDNLQGGRGNDLLDGGGGRGNMVSYWWEGGWRGVVVDFRAGRAIDTFGDVDTLVNVNEAGGTRFADTFIGADSTSVGTFHHWVGYEGADEFVGGALFTIVEYGFEEGGGAVRVDWSDGTAVDTYGFVDRFTRISLIGGTNRADVFIGDERGNIARGYGGADLFDLRGGLDSVDYEQDARFGGHAGVHVDLAAGFAIDGFGDRDTLIGVERVTGTRQADTLLGSAGADVLVGLGGNDVLDGRGGADRMEGGGGDDVYHVDDAGDVVIERSGEGVDRIVSSISFSLRDRAPNVENLTLIGTAAISGTGDDGANAIVGNDADNVLTGLDGDDLLVGGGGNDRLVGGRGADRLEGGAGVDTADYADSTFGVSVDLAQGRGFGGFARGDVLVAIENLVGSRFADLLVGDAGANRLDGRGGADVMRGLGGDDVYVVDDAADRIEEGADAGRDRVLASVSYALAAGVSVEELRTTSDSGRAAIDLTGNELAQLLVGNDGANRLDGGGGADQMHGRLGDDVYVVDHAGDRVFEGPAAGYDTVLARVSWTLASGRHVEEIRAADATSADPMTLVGNEFAQTLVGNAGANRLDGGGGADVMRGLGGDDVYVVDDAGDMVFEAAGEGADTVLASVSYALADGQHVEALRTASDRGTTPISLSGNAFAQQIAGNAGDNVIAGRGGADELFGLAGSDTFVFDFAPVAGEVARIRDFSVVDDTIRLDSRVFSALSPGALAADAFRIGPAAADASDRVVYDRSTGALFYDADGDGAAAAVQFAQLSSWLRLTEADFVVV